MIQEATEDRLKAECLVTCMEIGTCRGRRHALGKNLFVCVSSLRVTCSSFSIRFMLHFQKIHRNLNQSIIPDLVALRFDIMMMLSHVLTAEGQTETLRRNGDTMSSLRFMHMDDDKRNVEETPDNRTTDAQDDHPDEEQSR